MSPRRLITLLLALITLAAFFPATRNGFLAYDDNDYVTDNNVVKAGLTWAGTKWAFTTGHASNWHPLTWLSHMTDCELFGLNAGAHHLINALFHAANAVLLFWLLLRITDKIWPSALTAALFAWHPVHVESVAWIAERKDVLSTFFALLALLSYTKFVREPARRRYYWLALGWFAFGLMAKPMLVTLPLVMLLLDWWPLNRLQPPHSRLPVWRGLLVEKLPFFFLAAASCVVTLIMQRPAMSTLDALPLGWRLGNAAVSTMRYLGKIIWPADLIVAYPLVDWSKLVIALAVIGLAGISLAAWHGRRTRPYIGVGWLWFLGTLVPVIGLVQVGSTAMADRYTYFPAMGIFLLISFGLHDLASRSALVKKTIPWVMGAALLTLLGLTVNQLRHWHSSETLFRHALAVTPNNEIAQRSLGFAFDRQERHAEALAAFQESLRLNPRNYQVHYPMGNLLMKLNRPAEALAEYRECLARDPKVPALHNAAARALIALGQTDAAEAALAEAERLDPNYAGPHLTRAQLFMETGRDTNAVAELWLAVKTEPYNVEVLTEAARYLSASPRDGVRDGESAVVLALKANDLSSGSQPEVLDALGMAFAETRDFTNALTTAHAALELAETGKLQSAVKIRERITLYQRGQPWREPLLLPNPEARP